VLSCFSCFFLLSEYCTVVENEVNICLKWSQMEQNEHMTMCKYFLPLPLLRRIRQVRWLVWQDVPQQLVSAFILSWLDYCNSLLFCLPGSTIQPLQRVINAAARVNEFVAPWPCETSIETVTLAAGWAKKNLQAVSVYALHPHRTSTKIPFRLCFHSFCSQWQIST